MYPQRNSPAKKFVCQICYMGQHIDVVYLLAVVDRIASLTD